MRPFSLLIKPASADCNMRCSYCFYLDRSSLYPHTKHHRMSEAVLERTIQTYMATDQPQYVFGWQGGEPTLMGFDFFQRVIALQKRFGRPGSSVANGLQTNATLIDDRLAKLFAEYHFLVGVSLDGPEYIHNRYRRFIDKQESHEKVIRGIGYLQRHGVEFNILVLVSNATVARAREVYRYLCDSGFLYHQYIPCVEFDSRKKTFSITGEQWGDFLCELYDEWYPSDSRRVSIRLFDSILAYLVDGAYTICPMGKNCNRYLVVEYNGDVYPCDFFVEKSLRLGNVMRDSWERIYGSEAFGEFGRQKAMWDSQCSRCTYIELCNGDCLKHRMHGGRGSKGPSWLCAGWKKFYEHALGGFQRLAESIRMERIRHRIGSLGPETNGRDRSERVGRNDPCPCGSGLKYKRCCGR